MGMAPGPRSGVRWIRGGWGLLIRFTAWYRGEAELEMLNVSQVTAVLAVGADDVVVVTGAAGAAEVSVEAEEATLVFFCTDSCCGSCLTIELTVDGGLAVGGSVAGHEGGEGTVGLVERADSNCLGGEDVGGAESESGRGGDALRVRGSQGASPTGLLAELVTSLLFASNDSAGVVDVDGFGSGATSGDLETRPRSRGEDAPSFFGCTVSDLRFFFRMYSWRLTRRGGFGPSRTRPPPPAPISIPESGVEITSSSTLSSGCSSSSATPSATLPVSSTSMASALVPGCGAGAGRLADSAGDEVSRTAAAAAVGWAWPTCDLLGDDAGGGEGDGWASVERFGGDCFDVDRRVDGGGGGSLSGEEAALWEACCGSGAAAAAGGEAGG